MNNNNIERDSTKRDTFVYVNALEFMKFQARKDNLREAFKKFKELHPDYFKVKNQCECGSTYIKVNVKQHEKSRKHLYFIANKTTIV